MAIVIGQNTQVSFGGACVTQVSWNANPNTQRLYCLGSWEPELTIEKPTETISLTVYAPGPSLDVTPTTDCADANTVSCSITPAGCGGTVTGMSGNWFVTSYSYSKDDAQMPGTESWSMMRYIGSNTPSYVLRGISEGSSTTSANTGITFTGVTTTSSQGSVSAGQIGKADETEFGQVTNVGGGSSAAGDTGNGSASMPYTPLWL